ncbi:MAG: NAD(+) synthase [Rikenellaceae bacterium]
MKEYGYFRVASAIPKVKVGDTKHNASRTIALMREAGEKMVDVVLFPELGLTAYTCGDLFLQPTLLRGAENALAEILEASQELELMALVGMPIAIAGKLYSCAVAISRGKILGITPKINIPNYSEFYESRWFSSAASLCDQDIALCGQNCTISRNLILQVGEVSCAVEICEDLWVASPPSSTLCAEATVVFNLSASPDMVGKYDYLTSLVEQQSARCVAGYVYASAGCGESSTDLLFSGIGLIAENGYTIASAERHSLEEQLVVADLDIDLLQSYRRRMTTFTEGGSFTYRCCDRRTSCSKELLRKVDSTPFVPKNEAQREARCQEIFSIQSGALAQRLSHTGCKCAVIGISGGLDSTLALLVAVRAFDRLGLDRKGIIGVTMPGFGTTDRTYNNAVELMGKLGVTLREISIRKACLQHFEDIGLAEDDRSVSYENSQARERTQILMDISNMEGGMVIGTGDLSELALGWATYNGDHMSMYGVNGSVPKTLVRYLVGWAADREHDMRAAEILRDVIATPVSPELLPADENGDIAQKTEDLVGPYELHDFYLYSFVRQGFSPKKIELLARIAFAGKYDDETILKWLKIFIRRFFNQQFKRSAMPDGPKVGSVSLSPRGDWRMPSDATARLWLEELE